jgi:phage repressor protein C with HTH and peptisase S24 domain
MDIQDTIATWIRDARKRAGLSGADLGAKLSLELGTERGHTKGNISHWELGKHQPSIEQLRAISKITGVALPADVFTTSYDHLIDQASNAREARERRTSFGRRSTDVVPATTIVGVHGALDHADIAEIRKVKIRLSAGIAGFSIDPETGDGNPIFFRQDWLDQKGYKAEKLLAVGVRGPSMEPSLFAGDIVVINVADAEPRDGDVYAVNYEGEYVIKRLTRNAGKWWLTSDNPDKRRFPDKECADDSCILVGRVIYKQSERV